MVLPAELVRRIVLVGQGQLVLAKLSNLLLVRLAQELVLAVLHQLLLFAGKQVESDRKEALESHDQEAGGVALAGGSLLALLFLGAGGTLGLGRHVLAGSRVAGHDQRHGIQFIGGDEVQLLPLEVLEKEIERF